MKLIYRLTQQLRLIKKKELKKNLKMEPFL